VSIAEASPMLMDIPDTLYREPANTTADSARGSLRCPTKVVEIKGSILDR
jgi:hypothetical protein